MMSLFFWFAAAMVIAELALRGYLVVAGI